MEFSGNHFREEKRQKSEPFAKGSDFDRFLFPKMVSRDLMEPYTSNPRKLGVQSTGYSLCLSGQPKEQ
jgi:hypothetical protein